MSSPLKRNPFLVTSGNFLFHYRNSFFPLFFLVIVFLSKPLAPFGAEKWDRLLDLLGFAVALSGQILRAAVIGFAYIQRGGKGGRIHADELVQRGFFAHSRNPLYLGNMLVFLGLFIMLNSILGYVVGVPFFLFAYVSIVAAEEEFLQQKFGPQYTEYCRRVPRFFPELRGLRRSLQGMRFDWKRLIRKEYGATFAWMTTALVLVIWEIGRRQGVSALRSRMHVLLPLFGILLAAYLTARTLKKKRFLEARPTAAA